ncbi:MAG: hypothetical protein WAK48_15715 [Candidatus Acidiferrum sp.]|jgi:hypothetical protein
MTMIKTTTDRISHAQIRQKCLKDGDRWDSVKCPCCGGHLTLFGKDGFSCKGDSQHKECDPTKVAEKLHKLIDSSDPGVVPAEKPEEKRIKPSDLPGWRGISLPEQHAKVVRVTSPFFFTGS